MTLGAVLIDERTVRRRRTVLQRQIGAAMLFGVLCLTIASQELLDGISSAVSPTGHVVAAVGGAVGLVLVGFSFWWARHRERPLRALEDRVPVRPPPIPPPAPPGQVGETPPRGADPGWWCALLVGIAGALYLLVRIDPMIVGAPFRRTVPLEALVLVAWIVVFGAMLRTRPTADAWPDPADALDPTTRRRLARALAIRSWGVLSLDGPSRASGVPPDLVPTARARLLRAVHHRRRMTWVGAATSLAFLDDGLRELTRGAPGHDDGLMSLGLGVLGLLAALLELRVRRRAADHLATLGPAT